MDAEIFTKNNFLSFDEKWCFWPKVHYDLYIRFPGPYIDDTDMKHISLEFS
jgi:hypothetical protein